MEPELEVKKMHFKLPFQVTRKFFLAFLSLIGSFAALWIHLIDGAQWVTVVTLILSIHGAANIVDKKLGNAG